MRAFASFIRLTAFRAADRRRWVEKMIRFKIVHIFLFLVLGVCSCSVKTNNFVKTRVSPEPSNYAWWLRIEFSPVHKEIRGIPVHQLDPSWHLASELVKEAIPHQLLFENGSDIMKDLKLSFSRLGDFNDDDTEDLALIGVYEDKARQRGSFILILSKNKSGTWDKSFIEVLGDPKFAALSENAPIEIWFCMECDFGVYLLWDRENRKYVLKSFESMGDS